MTQLATATEIRSRAASGAIAVAARSIIVCLITFGGGVVLARLLQPRDFGIVALGSTAIAFGYVLADGGLGAALIRRSTAPSRDELSSLLGFQLGASIVLSIVI